MARRSIEERLAQLDAQRKTLQARLGKQERAADTRRKVLLGALVLQRLETSRNAEFVDRLRGWLRRELPGFLTREGDHALFPDLIDLPAGATAAATPPSSAGAPAPDARA
jgi:hypothetical protein